jgi:hypothetical protein
MTLQEYIEKYGTRKAAMQLVSKRIQSIIFLSLEDLPDTFELCELIDEIEDVLINGDMPYAKEQIKTILEQIDQDFIESLILN